MKQIHKLISLLMALLMTVGMVPVIPLAVTAENEEAPYKIGDFAYDPAWDCYEDWSKAIPNLRKYNVAAISDYVAACTDTGNRYIRLNWSTFGAMTFLNVEKGDTVVLDLASCKIVNTTDRGTMFYVEEGGTLIITSGQPKNVSQRDMQGCLFSNKVDAIMGKVDGNLLMLGGFLHCVLSSGSDTHELKVGKTGVVHVNGGGFLQDGRPGWFDNSNHITPDSEGEVHMYNGFVVNAPSALHDSYFYPSDQLKWHTSTIFRGKSRVSADNITAYSFDSNCIFGETMVNDLFTATPKAEDLSKSDAYTITSHLDEPITIDLRYQSASGPLENDDDTHPLGTLLDTMECTLETSYCVVDSYGITNMETMSDYQPGSLVSITAHDTGAYYVQVRYRILYQGKSTRIFERTQYILVYVTPKPITEVILYADAFDEYKPASDVSIPADISTYTMTNKSQWVDAKGVELTQNPKRGVLYYCTVTLRGTDKWGFDESTKISIQGTGEKSTNVSLYNTSYDKINGIINIRLKAYAQHLTHKWETTADSTYHWRKCAGCNETSTKIQHTLKQYSGVDSSGKAIFRCEACGYKGQYDVNTDGEIIKSVFFLHNVPLEGQTPADVPDIVEAGSTNHAQITDITYYNEDGTALTEFKHGQNYKCEIHLVADEGYTFASDLKSIKKYAGKLSGENPTTAGVTVSAGGTKASIVQSIDGSKILIPATVTVQLPRYIVGDAFGSKRPIFSCNRSDALNNENNDYVMQIFWRENDTDYLIMYSSDGTFVDLSNNELTAPPVYKKDVDYQVCIVPNGTKSDYSYTYAVGDEGTAYPGTAKPDQMFLLLATAPCVYGEYFTSSDESKIGRVDLSVKSPKMGEKLSTDVTASAISNCTVQSVAWTDEAGKAMDTYLSGNATLTVRIKANSGTEFLPVCSYSVNGNEAKVTDVSATEKTISYTFVSKDSATTVMGTIQSAGSEVAPITVELYKDGNAAPSYTKTVTGNKAEYSITNVLPGAYTMRVSKKAHCTMEYTITVSSGVVLQNVDMWLLGDVNGDKTVSAADALLTMQSATHAIWLSEDQTAAANVDGDSDTTIVDALMILQVAAGKVKFG